MDGWRPGVPCRSQPEDPRQGAGDEEVGAEVQADQEREGMVGWSARREAIAAGKLLKSTDATAPTAAVPH